MNSALVDFGQDLRVHGLPPDKPAWHIGLDDPKQPGKCWASLAVKDKAVATSGDYLRHFTHGGRRYGHIIDPRSGYPVDNGCLAATVVASTCTIAGILSTTAFILGAEEGLRLIESSSAGRTALTATHYAWLALGILMLAVYGSLIPFHVQPRPLDDALAAFRTLFAYMTP